MQFNRFGWESRPVLRIDPKFIGDFRKGLIFVEIQFGNSATLYRDFYKFQLWPSEWASVTRGACCANDA